MNWKHLDKSYVLFAMASSRCRYEQCIFLKKGPNGPYIQIPSRIGPPPRRLPVRSVADYLGVKMSYHNLEVLTFANRVHCAKLTQHRLRKRLHSPCIALKHRLRLWRSCTIATLHYGLLAVNLTLPIIQQYSILVMSMYRKITAFAPGTHMTRCC